MPLEAGSERGDSGSVYFIYDDLLKKWYAFAANESGEYSYKYNGKTSFATTHYSFTRDLLKKYNDGINILGSNITFNKGDNNFGIIQDENSQYKYYGINNHELVKVIRFKSDNANIQVNDEVDTYIARIDFDTNATLKGNGFIESAGFNVLENKKVVYNLKLDANKILRKIGKGTLEINSENSNEGTILFGEGLLILNNKKGYSAGNLKIASGRGTVKLNKENQVKDNNIFFGIKGGKLDLNGNNMSLFDICHLDSGAVITNSSNKVSNFNFHSNKDKVFLGSFTGNLNLNLSSNITWDLRGNSNILGDFNILNSKIIFIGDNLLRKQNSIIPYLNEYKTGSFISKNINLNNSTLNIQRAFLVNSNINVSKNSKINISTNGINNTENSQYFIDINRNKFYEDEDDNFEIENNKINIVGQINFENSSENNLEINLLKNHFANVNAKVLGDLNAIKNGLGTISFLNDNNVNGLFDIRVGKVEFLNDNSISNLRFNILKDGILEVKNLTNDKFLLTLDNISKSSNGVYYINGKDEFSLTDKINEHSNLYIATSSNIDLNVDKNIDTLNLSGDKGTINLHGSIKNINIAKVKEHLKIILHDSLNKNNVNINNIDNSKYILEYVDSTKPIVKPQKAIEYANALVHNDNFEIKEGSKGILLLNENDTDYQLLNTIFVGANDNQTYNFNKYSGEYNFSGFGKTNLNFKLENKNLIIDAQKFNKGGIVQINSSNNDYIGDIYVIGNNQNVNEGHITLRLNNNYAIGDNNLVILKDGGEIDLNGFDLKIKNSLDSNEYGKIVNSSSKKANLEITGDKFSIKNQIENNIILNLKNSEVDISNNVKSDVNLYKTTLNVDDKPTSLKIVSLNNSLINVNTSLSIDSLIVDDNSIINLENISNILKIKNVNDKEVKIKVKLNDLNIKELVNSNELLVITSNHDKFNYEFLKSLDYLHLKVKKEDNKHYIYALYDTKVSNIENILNLVYSLSNETKKYSNEVGVNGIFNIGKYENNKNISYGADIFANNIYDINKIKLNTLFSASVIKTSSNNSLFETKNDILNLFLKSHLDFVYKQFGININFNYSFAKGDDIKISNIDTSLGVSHNIDFKLKNANINLINELSIRYTPIIHLSYNKINNITPLSYAYKFILNTQLYDKYSIYLSAKLGYNQLKNEVIKNNEKILLKTMPYIYDIKLGTNILVHKNIIFNAEIKSYNQNFGVSLGMSYTY